MTAAQKIGHAAAKDPIAVKEIILGSIFGLTAGSIWKMYYWENHRRSKEFCGMLEKEEISVVAEK